MTLDKVLAGMRAAEAAGLTPIKVNCVAIGGTNDDELVEFAGWARDTGYEVRFIEYMPLDAQHAWEREKVVPAARILDAIDDVYPLRGGRARERTRDDLPFRRRRARSASAPSRRCPSPSATRATASDSRPRGCSGTACSPSTRRTSGRRSARARRTRSQGRDPHGLRRRRPGTWINHPDFVQPARSMSIYRRLTELLRGSANPHRRVTPRSLRPGSLTCAERSRPFSARGAGPEGRSPRPPTEPDDRHAGRSRRPRVSAAGHPSCCAPRGTRPRPSTDLTTRTRSALTSTRSPSGVNQSGASARSARDQSEAVDAPIRQRVDRLPLPDLLRRSLSSRTGT